MKNTFRFYYINKGFSLVELIVVLIITAILAQLGFTAFNRYVRRTRAFAAKTALKNIQRECESNRDLEAPKTFTLLPIKGYSIATRDTNSCYGQSSDGKVAAIANNQQEIPNYFYDFLNGEINCIFSGNFFEECNQNSQNAQNSQNSKLISFPKANKIDCINGQETGLRMYSYGVGAAWVHDCGFTDVKSLIGSGTISSGSGSINLSEKGEITFSGAYTNALNSIQRKELKKGGFAQIFAGGYGSYAAMREDGSMIVWGYSADDDLETINTLLNPPSEIKDIQFSYGGGAAKLKDGQILTWGNEGYASEFKYRMNK